jgi:hypothetical protein
MAAAEAAHDRESGRYAVAFEDDAFRDIQQLCHDLGAHYEYEVGILYAHNGISMVLAE